MFLLKTIVCTNQSSLQDLGKCEIARTSLEKYKFTQITCLNLPDIAVIVPKRHTKFAQLSAETAKSCPKAIHRTSSISAET